MDQLVRKMTVGDRVPNFYLDDTHGVAHELYNTDLSGGPIVVLVLARNGDDTVRQFDENTAAFEAFGAHLYALAPSEDISAACGDSAFFVVNDPDGSVGDDYLTTAGLEAPAMFALDPNQRIVACAGGTAAAGFAETARAAFDKIAPREAPRNIAMQAPVLFVPEVLDEALCDRLIAAWGENEHTTNIVNVASGEQSTVGPRADSKRRDDFIVDGELERELLVTLMPRIAPEIERAFNFDKEWMFEKLRVGCYDAKDAGFFRPHRDNDCEALDHRKFPVSISLNGGFEGGYVRFLEYGHDRYAPPKGGALIFSCGLLHEVAPVLKGRRFILLSFIFTN